MTLPETLTTTAQITHLAEQLAKETIIAVDLEADSMHNYRDKVCLLQVSTDKTTLLIDPLQVDNLDPLRDVLADPAIRKIFHAGDYDLRSLHRDFNLEIDGLFDTMICAQFMGEEKIGLADLLGKYYGVQLDKRFQRADWSKRPLSDEMLHYAAEDTRHLHRLAVLCEDRLTELGRLSWAQEEFQLLEQVRFNENNGPLCLRFKGAGKLERRQLGVLEQLLQWREREAERRDHPPFKILGNQALLAMAYNPPRSVRGLAAIEGMSVRQAERYGRSLLDAIRAGINCPEQELPVFPRTPRRAKDPAADARLVQLKNWRKKKAVALRLDPGVLANNVLLESLARSNPGSPEALSEVSGLKNWQRSEFGEEWLGLLK
jgi:ribonuclease D